ncbi:MAG TPA: ABC transporter permease [Longimicrobiales bacterium]
MSGLVWETEWRIALRRPRLFALNVLVPLLLAVPIAVSEAPAGHAAAVYAVLFVIHATFGSAIPLVRDAETGLVGRALRAGVRPGEYLLERCASGALLDGVQLLPSLLVACWGLGSDAAAFAVALASLVLALWAANLLGVLVAAAARTIAEAALFAAVSALLLLHVSGVFRAGAPGSLSARIEAAAPFRAIHEALLHSAGGGARPDLTIALAWAVVLPAILLLLATRLGPRLAGTPPRDAPGRVM